jgi:Zn-dependent M28 family amino/carboxypeptidase
MPKFVSPAIVALFVLVPIMGQPVSVSYGTLPQSEIERRLNAFEDSNAKREKRLLGLFQESGCTDNLTEQPVKHVKVANVVCILPGATDSIILVAGHFDFINAGKGVVDNWSGCALLPSLYASLKFSPRRHTFIFVGFTDEERGLIGSQFYVSKMSKENIKKISAMVNLDSLGTSPTKVERDRGADNLLDALGRVAAAMKLPVSIMNVHKVGRSDADSFQDRKVPAISIHSLTQETFPILHSRRDQLDAIHLSDYYETYLLIRAYLPYLDQTLDSQQ